MRKNEGTEEMCCQESEYITLTDRILKYQGEGNE